MKPFMFGEISNSIPFEKQVCIYIDRFDTSLPEFKYSDYRVFVQLEPPEIHNPQNLYNIADQFDLILTWNEEILQRYSHASLFYFGSCWIPEQEQRIYPKTKNVSIIASDKNYLEGHVLRHTAIEKFNDQMDVYGRGYKYVESKTEALNNYRFSIVIENTRHRNWFTEKLMDCLRTGTVPVYWGMPNISDLFDPRGFITFDTIDELNRILPTLTKKKYEEMLPYIKKNFVLAEAVAYDWHKRLHSAIESKLKTAIIKKTNVFKFTRQQLLHLKKSFFK